MRFHRILMVPRHVTGFYLVFYVFLVAWQHIAGCGAQRWPAGLKAAARPKKKINKERNRF